MMQILNTGIDTADANMRLDEKLLENLKEFPILHLYEWARPSATFGLFIQPEKHLDLLAAEKWGVDLAKRPTGGGIVFHIWDLAFSFLMPSTHPKFSLNTLENYQFVNSAVLEAMTELFSFSETPILIKENAPSLGPDCQNFCMAKPTQYDVVYQGLKIAGSAQRRRKQGYLHQGTISLAAPNAQLLEEVLLSKEDVLAAMQSFTFSPLGKEVARIGEIRQPLQNLLADKLEKALRF